MLNPTPYLLRQVRLRGAHEGIYYTGRVFERGGAHTYTLVSESARGRQYLKDSYVYTNELRIYWYTGDDR